jgi:hypothetical protein
MKLQQLKWNVTDMCAQRNNSTMLARICLRNGVSHVRVVSGWLGISSRLTKLAEDPTYRNYSEVRRVLYLPQRETERIQEKQHVLIVRHKHGSNVMLYKILL